MAKFELATTIAILFAMSAPLGLMAETLITGDLITDNGPIKEMINIKSVEEEKKFCLELLSQRGVGFKCIEEVNLALVFGVMTDATLVLQCCRNVLDVDMANNKCFKLIFGGQGEIQIVLPSLMEFCRQEVLEDLAPKPASQLED